MSIILKNDFRLPIRDGPEPGPRGTWSDLQPVRPWAYPSVDPGRPALAAGNALGMGFPVIR